MLVLKKNNVKFKISLKKVFKIKKISRRRWHGLERKSLSKSRPLTKVNFGLRLHFQARPEKRLNF